MTSKQSINILRITTGAGLEAIYRKYKTIDFYFITHLIPGFTDLVIYSVCFTNNNYMFPLRDDYILMETGYLFNSKLLTVFYFILRHIKIIKKYNINIIHSPYPYGIGLLGLILAKIMRLPFCVSIHADYEQRQALEGNAIPSMFGSLKISRWIEGFVYRHADLVLPIRESMIKHLLEAGCIEDKIRIFPHGLDLSVFDKKSDIDIRAYFNIPQDVRIISSVSRLYKENYSDDILEIAVKSVNKFENLYFIICGGGAELEELRGKVIEAGLNDRIILPGFISNDIVCELRRQSYISLCLMAGFSLIEACAGGNPVISYDVEWHYELVKDNETGFLVHENDITTVLEKIEYLIRNPQKAVELGLNAKRLAFERHSLEATNKIKADIYRELIDVKRHLSQEGIK